MSSTLNTNTALSGDHYLVTGSLASGGTLPQEVFIYENTGDGSLGDFYGTCSLAELGRLPIQVLGTPISTFGNKYVRYGQVKIKISLADDPVAVIVALVHNVGLLSKAYNSQVTTSKSFVIP